MGKVIYNGGQRHEYAPDEPVERYERVPYDVAEIVETAPLEFHPKFADPSLKIFRDVTEFIPGVDSKMVDWWWANMEKGYHMWAPGEHYGFDWIVPPCEVGYEGSIEASYEFDPRIPPLAIERRPITEYPFTECYEHCWMSKAKFGEADTLLIHMYQDVEGGIHWRTVVVTTQEGIDFMHDHAEEMPLESHMEYESGRLKDFLPPLYEYWKILPDPWENVQYDLTTEQCEDGTWRHVHDNKPHKNVLL